MLSYFLNVTRVDLARTGSAVRSPVAPDLCRVSAVTGSIRLCAGSDPLLTNSCRSSLNPQPGSGLSYFQQPRVIGSAGDGGRRGGGMGGRTLRERAERASVAAQQQVFEVIRVGIIHT